jgi:hypothetical protein
MYRPRSGKIAGILAGVGVGVALLGGGVYATYTNSLAATASENVGNFDCMVSSPAGTPSGNSHAITITEPPILNSGSSNYPAHDITVTNTGTIPELVHWTFVKSGNLNWQPTGRIGYDHGSGSDLMDTDITLAGGASHTYAGAIGFQWATLINDDLGTSGAVTYTANCGEVPAAPQSKIQFIGFASHAGNAALTLPAGSTTGDTAVVLEAGSSVATPTGYTSIATPVTPKTIAAYKTLVAGDTIVPAGGASITDMEVAVYRGVSGVGAHTYTSGNLNNVGLSGGSPLYYPLKSVGLDGVNGPAMSKADGSSWVVNLGYDAYASTNMNALSFNVVISSSPTPYVMGAADATNRSSSSSDAHVGLADTAGGVATWAPSAWTVPGDNFPLPNSHGVADHVIELLSN